MDKIEDFNKLFSEIINNLEESNQIINESFIKNIINNWSIKDFRIDEDGKVTNDFAVRKLQHISQKIIAAFPINMMYTIIGLNKMQNKNIMRDNFCSNLMLICMFSFSVHQYFTKKIKNPTKSEIVFSNLTTSILDNIKGLLFSYMSDDYITVIQKIRIVYESYVVFLFLNKYKELIEPFFEHSKIIEQKIFSGLPNFEIDYGINDNQNDYLSWTQKKIPERKNRNLAFLANDIGIDKDMSVIYKLSSNFIHTNAYSILNKNAINRDYIRQYLPFVSDIMIRQLKTYLEIINKVDHQNVLINILLNGLQNILFSEILNQDK